VKPGVDQAFAGRGVLYLSRLVARASQSRLSRIVALPEYRQMTIRNWNTTTRLLALLTASSAASDAGGSKRRLARRSGGPASGPRRAPRRT
jgi:hypothetical protein